MTGPARHNEDRFYRYPKNRIVAVLPDNAHLTSALGALAPLGVSVPDVNVLSGPEGAHLLDRTGADHGPRARLLRMFQRGAYEVDALRNHEQALRDGEHVVYIPVRGKDQARKVAAAVRDAGGRYVLYFGAWTIGQLPAAPPGS